MANPNWAPQSPDLSGYAPQSPDLSAYNHNHNLTTTNPNHNHPLAPTSHGVHSAWAPQSPDVSAFQPQYDNQAPQLQQHLHHQPPQFSLDGHWDQKQPLQNQYLAPQYPQYPQQNPVYHDQQYQSPMAPQTRGHRVSYTEEAFKQEDEDWAPQAEAKVSQRGGRPVKPDVGLNSDPSFNSIPASIPSVPQVRQKMDTGGVEVKTKFPTARIKRIMQADEDVGKVAQVTPVVMAKALELFMIRLITASSGLAKQRGSKRVLTSHMKAAVMQDDQFDNLREIVGKIPDAPTKGKGGDDDSDEAEGKKRKKSAAGTGRGKKKRDSDDDF